MSNNTNGNGFLKGFMGCFGVGAAVVLAGVGCTALVVVGMSDSDESSTDTSTATASEEAVEAGTDEADESYTTGDTVSHGQFDIVVDNIEEGVTSYTDSFDLTNEPTGQYVVVTMTATNTSSGPEYLWEDDQVLLDGEGRMYTYSPDVMGMDFMAEMNPGQTITGELIYDVPTDVELSHMMVNGDAALSEGVRVDFE